MTERPLKLWIGRGADCVGKRVTASFLEFSRLGNDRRQRLSSEFVARSAATFGVGRNHTDPKATEQDRGREAVEECTPSNMLTKVLHCGNLCTTLVGRLIRQVEYRSPYIHDTHSLELSSNISLETSRNPGTFRTLLDCSGRF